MFFIFTNDRYNDLIKESIAVRKHAYSPYSHYKVGAALLAASGKIYTGCNFENAAFGAGVCAERIALGNAIASGERRFIAICVCGKDNSITPCGICRQSLTEFGDIDVICCDDNGQYKQYTLSQILPFSFQSANL